MREGGSAAQCARMPLCVRTCTFTLEVACSRVQASAYNNIYPFFFKNKNKKEECQIPLHL